MCLFYLFDYCMRFGGVLWGFRDEKELRDFGADFIVSNPLEILKIIK